MQKAGGSCGRRLADGLTGLGWHVCQVCEVGLRWDAGKDQWAPGGGGGRWGQTQHPTVQPGHTLYRFPHNVTRTTNVLAAAAAAGLGSPLRGRTWPRGSAACMGTPPEANLVNRSCYMASERPTPLDPTSH